MKYSHFFLTALMGALIPLVSSAAPLPVTDIHDARQSTRSPSDVTTAGDVSLWKAWGGELQIRWNRDLMRDYGMPVSRGEQLLREKNEGVDRLEVRSATGIDIAMRGGAFDGFGGGSLSVRGGFDLTLADGTIPMRDLVLRPRKDDAFVLDVVSGDGKVWFYVDRLMYEILTDPSMLHVRAMDLRMTPALASRLGDESLSGHVVANMRLYSHVHGAGFADVVAKGVGSKWHGEAAPGGGIYEADVFMWTFNAQYMRRDAAANGPGGSDGLVVYAPSSTLSNNKNNGTAGVTVTGDPLGTSSALNTANVPWFEKFTGNFAPHGNDQHPYLIWNLYRIDSDNRITQVGRSGVKHAFLTTNSPCDEHPGTSHILGRGCRDTYGTSNNDAIDDLGARNEIIPATGQWGRCRSKFDADCNGAQDAGAPCSNMGTPNCNSFGNRLTVNETQIDPTEAANAGATYLFESWYVVRDDVNIYNTMQTRPATFSWTGSAWAVGNGTPLQLGSAIDRWMPRGTNTPTQRSSDIKRAEGEGRVAAKVTDLGGGQFRYDYAVMNFSFAEAVTSGAEPNLQVLSNDGFTAFHLLLPENAVVSSTSFNDGDADAGNNWTPTQAGDALTWTAPAGGALNWGTMFRFSLVVNSSPIESDVRLTTAQAPTPDFEIVTTLGPGGSGVGGFSVGGAVTGVAGSDGVDLLLNGGAGLTVTTNSSFVFATQLADGDAYAVTIARQPTGRACLLGNATGTIQGANVVNVSVTCDVLPPDQVTIGGVVSGLSGGSVSVTLNGGAPLAIAANGGFTFPGTIAEGSPYAVVVSAEPFGKDCAVVGGNGTAPAGGVDDIQVNCTDSPITQHSVGVTLTNLLPQTQVTLQLNGGSNLPLVANGSYVFGAMLSTGTNYVVTVFAQPAGQSCTVSNGSGVIENSNITDVAVSCVALPPTYTVGGSVAGLESGHSVTLSLNGSETLVRSVNGAFVFATELDNGDTYDVAITAEGGGTDCTLTNGDDVIAGVDVTDISVTCVPPPAMGLFTDGFED